MWLVSMGMIDKKTVIFIYLKLLWVPSINPDKEKYWENAEWAGEIIESMALR